MKLVVNLIQADPAIAAAVSPLNNIEPGVWPGVLAALAVFLAGSAFWRASARLRDDNAVAYWPQSNTYTWQRDPVLLTYLLLLLTLVGLTVYIASTDLPGLSFWYGYAAVWAGQQTLVGRRLSYHLVHRLETALRPRLRIVREEVPVL